MTFSMATDGYPALHQPWGHWPPLHMQGTYMPPHWQSGVSSGSSCMYGMPPEYRNEKPPLTQLQELASVFPSPVETEASSNDADTGYVPETHYRASDTDRDSGFGPDMKVCDREPDAGYSSDRPLDCEAGFASERSDSGFGPAFPLKEELDPFPGEGGDSGCAPDMPLPMRENHGDTDSGCADMDTPSALPGFHQAFGSTEIGRFSRNDFFTNPSPPKVVEPVTEPPKKPPRKPRTPRVKQVRKDCSDSPKPRPTESQPSVPIPESGPCSPRVCPPTYNPCPPPHRYCPDYPYMRNYPSYPPCEVPYFQPFPSFPLDCGQTWHEHSWPPYQTPYQPPYQPQQPWTSANVYPFMRLDY